MRVHGNNGIRLRVSKLKTAAFFDHDRNAEGHSLAVESARHYAHPPQRVLCQRLFTIQKALFPDRHERAAEFAVAGHG
ncbi:MAG: hypothetical protein L6R00_15725, partial [Phycisphaerae bacterium]|nr:hypothetical protein [Phycisphaerae bacterium]